MPTTSSPSTALARGKAPLLIVVLLLAVIFGGIYLWRGARLAASSAGYAPPPVEVSATPVAAETLPQFLSTTGSLVAVQGVQLAPEVAGRIVSIRFQAGQQVTSGAVLVQLFDAPERADRAAAVARLNLAQTQVQRSRSLAPTGAEPREFLQQREAELAQAQAAIEQIDARIAQRTITAPFGGQIGVRQVNLGQFVNAGDPIATLTALDRLYVNFSVPQQDLSQLRVGGNVRVRSDTMPGRELTARINAIEPVVSGDTRTVGVQALMHNPGGALRPGLFVTVDISQQSLPSAILVPATAVMTTASGDSIFIVKDGKANVVPVTLGREVGERIVVASGMNPGDVIVTKGQNRLQPGATVKVIPSARVSVAPAAAGTR